jgi:hypothetical protein
MQFLRLGLRLEPELKVKQQPAAYQENDQGQFLGAV